MISEHDRQILSRLPSWNPAGDMVAQRRAWEELAVVYNQDLPAIGALEENVELRAGLRADVAVPKRPGPHPVAIYLHGGGWAFGSPVSFRKLGMQFAQAGYLTIILDYGLAPGHPSPAALEDTVFAIGWAADNARRWNGDGRRIAIGGDSAGANLAASAITSRRFRAARAGARGTAFLRRLRSHGDRAAQPIEPRASVAAEHLRVGHRNLARRSARQSAQGGGTGTVSAMLYSRSGQ